MSGIGRSMLGGEVLVERAKSSDTGICLWDSRVLMRGVVDLGSFSNTVVMSSQRTTSPDSGSTSSFKESQANSSASPRRSPASSIRLTMSQFRTRV